MGPLASILSSPPTQLHNSEIAEIAISWINSPATNNCFLCGNEDHSGSGKLSSSVKSHGWVYFEPQCISVFHNEILWTCARWPDPPQKSEGKTASIVYKKQEHNADQRSKTINISYPRAIWWERKTMSTNPVVLLFCLVNPVRSLYANLKFPKQEVKLRWLSPTAMGSESSLASALCRVASSWTWWLQ